MSAPQALIEFFQQEAIEYLDRLEQLLAASENACPDASAFLTHARALRGSATMTRLEALPDLAATVERIAGGLRDGELRWDQRLHFAVHGALVELRDLVSHANDWTETEQRRSRTQSVALASVAAGYFSPPSIGATSTPVVPISRFFPDDGLPGILERNSNPPCTLPQRFRSDIAAAGALIAREAGLVFSVQTGAGLPASTDALRRALLGLGSVGESYGATSIAALSACATRSHRRTCFSSSTCALDAGSATKRSGIGGPHQGRNIELARTPYSINGTNTKRSVGTCAAYGDSGSTAIGDSRSAAARSAASWNAVNDCWSHDVTTRRGCLRYCSDRIAVVLRAVRTRTGARSTRSAALRVE